MTPRMRIANKIAKDLKRKRRMAGITQQKLADLVGISRVDVTRYENGTVMPPADKYFHLLEILDKK